MNGIKKKIQVNPEENGDFRNPEYPSGHVRPRHCLGTLSEQTGLSPYLHNHRTKPPAPRTTASLAAVNSLHQNRHENLEFINSELIG